MTPRVLDRLSIAARLQLLSVSLILVIAGSNLYLTRALQQAAAKAQYADRTVSQIEIVQGVRAAFEFAALLARRPRGVAVDAVGAECPRSTPAA